MARNPIRVLVVDDDSDDYLVLRDLLEEIEDNQFDLEWASTYEKGKLAIERRSHDVCFLDYRLGPETGLSLLKEMIARGHTVPIILLTGYGEHEVDVEAMRVGAADYLIKDKISPALLERSIRYSIHRKETLEALREREESIRSLLDSTFEGIFLHDSKGLILSANQATAEIFGYTIAEMIGTPLDLYCGEGVHARVVGSGRSENRVSLQSIGSHRSGARIDLEISAKPYHHLGRPVHLVALRDISAKRQMEAQMLMQERLASVGLLASSLAHEIGTPLGVVRGRAEYLALQTENSPVIKKNVDVIISQIDRISKLIHSLLHLARGDQLKNASHILLNTTVQEVLELMSHELRRHAIEIRNRLDAAIPIAITAESQPLHQVLLNLLINSVHAIESAVKDGRTDGHFIQIDAQDLGKEWALNVRDSGCGISEKNMKNLFKPFFTTKDIGVGTGLGLVTSYRIVETWGGRIQVESKEGIGTKFTLLLPKASLPHPGA